MTTTNRPMISNREDAADINIRTEQILVLYGSQTGNSEQAAIDFCEQMKVKLNPTVLGKLTSALIQVEPICMQLDDFLELHHCQWTRIFVIFVSSYGIGQAPLGAHRFRELCDAWLNNTNESNGDVLKGTQYAMCGLGDSKYTTFFNNPKCIDAALTKVGSKRIGPLGVADASGTGVNTQSLVIDGWIDSIWSELANVIVSIHRKEGQQQPDDEFPALPKSQLQRMQQVTFELCQQINPDLQKQRHGKNGNNKKHNDREKENTSTITLYTVLQTCVFVGIVIIAIVISYF